MGGMAGLLGGANGHVNAPTDQNMAQQGQSSLAAEQGTAGGQYQDYSQYAPQYTQTNVNTLGSSLFGSGYSGDLSDINQQLTNQANQQTTSSNSALRQGNLTDTQMYAPGYQNQLIGANSGLYSDLASQQKAANTGIQQNDSQTLMNSLASDPSKFQPVQLNNVAGQNVRAQNVYAPQTNATLQGLTGSYNPGLSATQSAANQQAQSLLAQGGNLSPSELTGVQQASRAAYAARGLDGSNSSIVNEAMQTDAAQRARQQQNIATAEGIEGQSNAEQQAQQNYGLGLSGQQQQYGAMGLSAQQGNQSSNLNASLANQANNFSVQSANNANALSSQQANLASQNQQYNQLGQAAQLDYSRQAQNFGLGQAALGNYQANLFDPEAAVANQNSSNAGNNATMYGVANAQNENTAIMNMFNPYSSYASTLNNTNANNTDAANMASASNKVTANDQLMSTEGQVASSLISKF